MGTKLDIVSLKMLVIILRFYRTLKVRLLHAKLLVTDERLQLNSNM